MKCRPNRYLLVVVVFMLATACPTTASSLMEAASKGETEKVQALLAQGADVNTKTKGGATTLSPAAYNGCTDTVKALLAAGAHVNAKNKRGETALMKAEKRGHKEIIQLLKDAGAKE